MTVLDLIKQRDGFKRKDGGYFFILGTRIAGISKEALAQMNMQDFVEATKTQKSGGMGYGIGLNKQEAEQEAAKAALLQLGKFKD